MKGQHFSVPGGMICIHFLTSYTDDTGKGKGGLVHAIMACGIVEV